MKVVIGGTAIRIETRDRAFEDELRGQYGAFIEPDAPDPIQLTVDLVKATTSDPDAGIQVRHESNRWIMDRGDFHACYDPSTRSAVVHQTAGRYGLDSAIRIIHSLVLAEECGLLLHASSVIHNDCALVFAGPSGAGKTTISRLAREGDHLLTDEISCLRKTNGAWTAFGTPFAGELARPGENRRAPVGALYLLRHGRENELRPMSAAAAAQAILRNVLFFADDSRLASRVFDTVCDLVRALRVFELSFLPDERVWSLIS